MLTLVRSAAVLALSLATIAPAAAQDVPNLSGTWVMDAAKSDFGPIPAPATRSDVIDHREPALTIKRSILTPGAAAPSVVDLKYQVDGKPHTNTTPQGDITSTLKWDGKVLVVTSQVPTPGGPADVTDRFSLSADGKTLTQNRTIAVQGQEIAQIIILVKQ